MAERCKVIIVEDDDESREALKDVFELEGYEVRTASHGGEALDLVDAGVCDACCVMLLDLFMPGVSGWEVYDQLGARGKLSSIKVIVITSAPHRAPAGATVLQKPLDIAKLLRAVAAVCQAAAER